MTIAAASAELVARGFVLGVITNESSASIAAGLVIRPGLNGVAAVGASVPLVISLGNGQTVHCDLALRVTNVKVTTALKRIVTARIFLSERATVTTRLVNKAGRTIYTRRSSLRAGTTPVRLTVSRTVMTPGR